MRSGDAAATRRLVAGAGASLRFLRRFTIPRQWLLAYLLLIVVPAGIFLYGYYERSAKILKDEVVRTMQQTLKQAGSNLSYRLEHLQDISNAAFMNSNLHSYLSVGADDQSIAIQLEVIKDLRYLVDTVQLNSDVFHVRIFVDRSKLYAGELINFFSLDSLKDNPLYDAIVAANGGIVWTGGYNESFLDTGNQRVFSMARMLRDPNHYDTISGVLMIDVRESMLGDILADLQFSPGTQVYLVDPNGKIVYHPDQARIGAGIDPAVQAVLKRGGEGTGTLELNGEANDVMFTTLNPTGWKLVAQGTESQLSRRAVQLTQKSEWTSLLEYIALFLLLPFVLLAIIVRGMNRRVKQVITVIRKEGTESSLGRAAAGQRGFPPARAERRPPDPARADASRGEVQGPDSRTGGAAAGAAGADQSAFSVQHARYDQLDRDRQGGVGHQPDDRQLGEILPSQLEQGQDDRQRGRRAAPGAGVPGDSGRAAFRIRSPSSWIASRASKRTRCRS